MIKTRKIFFIVLGIVIFLSSLLIVSERVFSVKILDCTGALARCYQTFTECKVKGEDIWNKCARAYETSISRCEGQSKRAADAFVRCEDRRSLALERYNNYLEKCEDYRKGGGCKDRYDLALEKYNDYLKRCEDYKENEKQHRRCLKGAERIKVQAERGYQRCLKTAERQYERCLKTAERMKNQTEKNHQRCLEQAERTRQRYLEMERKCRERTTEVKRRCEAQAEIQKAALITRCNDGLNRCNEGVKKRCEGIELPKPPKPQKIELPPPISKERKFPIPKEGGVTV